MNNNNQTKIPLSPEEAYLASKLFGRSLFSAIQLAKEQEEATRRMEGLGGGDTLRIPIPVNTLHKTSEEGEASPGLIGRAIRFNRNPIRSVFGGEAGFHEARREYFQQQKMQIQRELQDAQKEYLQTLQKIKQGELETPNVDAFCNGLAAEATISEILPKTAGNTAEDVEISDHSLKRLLGKGLGILKKPVDTVIDLGATGLIGTGAGSAYLTYVIKKKLREKNHAEDYISNIPTRVELEPYNIG